MRTWRVGTISMGLTLIFLGVFLVLTQFLDWKPAYAMTSWWPLILIVLGIEILIYLFLSKQENTLVKYDLFSIFFVGVIGFIGIGLAMVQATGILDKVHDWTNYEVKTLDLPTFSANLDDSVKRVVVHTGTEPLTIETGTASEVSVFGTYVTEVVEGKTPVEVTEDYLFTEIKGDTLYVKFKRLPETANPFGHHREQNATMIIPSHVEVEIDSNHQLLYVNSRTLNNNWTIENASDVNLQLASNLDVTLNAENIAHFSERDEWKFAVKNSEDEQPQSGTKQLGEGTYVMNILNASTISVVEK